MGKHERKLRTACALWHCFPKRRRRAVAVFVHREDRTLTYWLLLSLRLICSPDLGLPRLGSCFKVPVAKKWWLRICRSGVGAGYRREAVMTLQHSILEGVSSRKTCGDTKPWNCMLAHRTGERALHVDLAYRVGDPDECLVPHLDHSSH